MHARGREEFSGTRRSFFFSLFSISLSLSLSLSLSFFFSPAPSAPALLHAAAEGAAEFVINFRGTARHGTARHIITGLLSLDARERILLISLRRRKF
jgi:hypothetical protein